EDLRRRRVVLDRRELVQETLRDVAHLRLRRRERVDVRLLRRRPVALVEVVELVERLVAERLQRRQRAGGARGRGLEREGGDDRERLAAERQGLRRARGP